MKNFSLTMAGVWTSYGVQAVALVNQIGGTNLDASCVENVGTNFWFIAAGIAATGVAHFGRQKQGDVSPLGFKKF